MNLSMMPFADANDVLLAKPFILTEERTVVLGPLPATEGMEKHLLRAFVVAIKG
jgi:hypothetical protein